MSNFDGQTDRTGNVCLRPYQEKAIERIRERIKARIRRVLVVAPTGSGKCVTRETLVWSKGLRFLGEIWGSDRIEGPLGSAKVTGWYDDGEREGVLVKLECGLSIDSTANHRVWVREISGREGWKNAARLSNDDFVAVALGRADFGENRIPLDEARALGSAMAKQGRDGENGVPRSILLGTREVIQYFLRGFFDVNGGPSVSTPSLLVAEQVHQLLLGLGIYCSHRQIPSTNAPTFIIEIRDSEAFAKHVGFDDSARLEISEHRENHAWSRVESVQPSFQGRIDCEVAEQHAFIGNGIINHNTVIASSIIKGAADRGLRVLFLAHRRELINQAYSRLIAQGLSEEQVGVIMASDPRRRPDAVVQVASVDTLRNRAKPPADIVFVDECHRAVSRSYQKITTEYPHAVHLGLTATPYRADGRGLRDCYDALVVVASPKQLIAEGFLVEPRVFTVPADALPDLSKVRIRGGDYDESMLAEAIDRKSLIGNLVQHWLKYAANQRTVAFAVSIAHSQHIAERFREAGVAAEHLDGTTPLAERDAILARLDAGVTRVVSNCGVLAEGWDQPSVKCAILARPTKSTGLYLQQAGRILRPWNNERAIILDHGGCAIEHGLPQDDRFFNLESGKKVTKKKRFEPPAKSCPECYAVMPHAAGACPECGFIFEDIRRRVPKESEGALEEISDGARAAWDRLCATAALRGYKPGWVYYRYREKFGEPPKSFIVEDDSAEILELKQALLDAAGKSFKAQRARK